MDSATFFHQVIIVSASNCMSVENDLLMDNKCSICGILQKLRLPWQSVLNDEERLLMFTFTRCVCPRAENSKRPCWILTVTDNRAA